MNIRNLVLLAVVAGMGSAESARAEVLEECPAAWWNMTQQDHPRMAAPDETRRVLLPVEWKRPRGNDGSGTDPNLDLDGLSVVV